MTKLNQKSLVILLLVLLVLAMIYIVFDKIQETREQEQLAAFQEGLQTGYEQAIVQVMENLATCQTVPLFAGNQTLTAIAVECLQQPLEQQQA